MEFSMDFRFLQDFYVKLPNGKRNTLQLSIDIFNFTNLINPDWGRRRFAGSFGNYNLIDMDNRTTGSNTAPEYTINTDLIDGDNPWTGRVDDNGFRSSKMAGSNGSSLHLWKIIEIIFAADAANHKWKGSQ
jgi:hypothetical protein